MGMASHKAKHVQHEIWDCFVLLLGQEKSVGKGTLLHLSSERK